jgi:hypothetical protein
VSVVEGPSAKEQLSRLQAQRPKPDARRETAFAAIGSQKETAQRLNCDYLLDEIARVDSLGRLENKPHPLERLRTQRRELVEELHRQNCSIFKSP